MSREIIQEALNGIRDEYITEAGVKLGLVAAGTAAVGAVGAASGAAVDPATLYPLSGTENAVKTGFGAWLAKGGWVALIAGVLVAAGVAVGAFLLGNSGDDTPPVGSGDVTTAEQEQSRFEEDVSEETTEDSTEDPTEVPIKDPIESESEYENDAGIDSLPQEDSTYFQFPLTEPDDESSRVAFLTLPPSETYLGLTFVVPTTDHDLEEIFTLPLPTESERNILVLFCEGIIDPSYQTGSSYCMLYFIESTFVEQINGIEQRTVQMSCGRVDFYDTPMPVPSGDSVSYTYYHADKTASATVTYSEANRDRVLAQNRHNNMNVLDQADELLFEYGKETYKLTVLYSYTDGVETKNSPVESLPDFSYKLFRTYALP